MWLYPPCWRIPLFLYVESGKFIVSLNGLGLSIITSIQQGCLLRRIKPNISIITIWLKAKAFLFFYINSLIKNVHTFLYHKVVITSYSQSHILVHTYVITSILLIITIQFRNNLQVKNSKQHIFVFKSLTGNTYK